MPEQLDPKVAYEQAVEAQAAAKKAYDDLKAQGAPIAEALKTASKAFRDYKPSLVVAKAHLDKATADVTIARAALPKEAVTPGAKGTGNAQLLEAVKTVLAGKPEGLSNEAIFDALQAAGVEMAGDKPRQNLNAYLSRWASAGSLTKKMSGSYALPGQNAAPAVPPFLAPPVADGAPTGQQPVDGALTGDLPLDFPGIAPLHESGFRTYESLAGKSKVEDFQAIKGIGKATAEKIVAALSA